MGQPVGSTVAQHPGCQPEYATAGWVVASQPLGSAQDTLNVTVTEFNGRYDGKVIVSGEWLLNHQGQLIKRPFRLEGVQTQDGYDEMVKVLAGVWSQEAASIAQEIKRLP
ncbi:putative lipoprotein [Escherichia coli]|uniref:Putative lipoprotein n=1 Tax=Escherichia coli TaxID=562 RepID=A0A376KXF5_ECOLX|nr:putative lipoprotein [Escherichia coli]